MGPMEDTSLPDEGPILDDLLGLFNMLAKREIPGDEVERNWAFFAEDSLFKDVVSEGRSSVKSPGFSTISTSPNFGSICLCSISASVFPGCRRKEFRGGGGPPWAVIVTDDRGKLFCCCSEEPTRKEFRGGGGPPWAVIVTDDRGKLFCCCSEEPTRNEFRGGGGPPWAVIVTDDRGC